MRDSGGVDKYYIEKYDGCIGWSIKPLQLRPAGSTNRRMLVSPAMPAGNRIPRTLGSKTVNLEHRRIDDWLRRR